MPFVESTELALIVDEPHATVHRALSSLLADGVVGRATHGTVHLPSSGRYCLTACFTGVVSGVLAFDNIIRDVTGVIVPPIIAVNEPRPYNSLQRPAYQPGTWRY